MAQLAERWLSIPEFHRSNRVIGKILKLTYLLLTVEKTKVKEKEAGNGRAFKKNYQNFSSRSQPIYFNFEAAKMRVGRILKFKIRDNIFAANYTFSSRDAFHSKFYS